MGEGEGCRGRGVGEQHTLQLLLRSLGAVVSRCRLLEHLHRLTGSMHTRPATHLIHASSPGRAKMLPPYSVVS